MVIADLDLVGVPIFEPEADSPLIVDRDGVLTLPVSLQRMQPVTRRYPEVIQTRRQIDVLELAGRSS